MGGDLSTCTNSTRFNGICDSLPVSSVALPKRVYIIASNSYPLGLDLLPRALASGLLPRPLRQESGQLYK